MKKSGIISEYIRHRGLLVSFVARDIKGRYTGSVLGILWSLVQPLVMLALYTVVFSILLKVTFPAPRGGSGSTTDAAIYICCAILPWIAFQESLQRAVSSLVDNANLIKKVAFPSAVIPLHLVISGAINQIPGTVLLVVMVAVIYGVFPATLVLLPVVWVLQVAFTAGLGWMLSSFNVFFRDVRHIVAVGVLIWMFLTPIFYPAATVEANADIPGWLKTLYAVNPMKLIVDFYRNAIYLQVWPQWWEVLLLVGYAGLTAVVGHAIFIRNKDRFADLL